MTLPIGKPMTDKGEQGVYTADAVFRGVLKKTSLLTVAGVLAAAGIQPTLQPELPFWSVPGGVLFGGVLGVLNFRWLAYAVERVYLHKNSTSILSNVAAAVINILKLSVIFVILYIVIQRQIVHLIGLVFGLSLCFLAILWQGFGVMTGDSNKGP